MNSKEYIVSEFRRELIEAYRTAFDERSPVIAWSDAVCDSFAALIRDVVQGLYTEDVLTTNDHYVSETTIQRILNNQLDIKDNIHQKTRRVLDNICLYLGYRNWNAFEEAKEKTMGIFDSLNKSGRKNNELSDEEKERVTFYMKLIKEAKQAEFDAYKNLYEHNNMAGLEKYYDPNEGEYKRIHMFGNKMAFHTFEMQFYRSRFSIEAGVLSEEEGRKNFFIKMFSHQEWQDKAISNNEYYFSLYTYQWVSFNDENKITNVRYNPVCARDRAYVDSVYGRYENLIAAEQSSPSPYDD